ncbi:head-tail connector protein [Butyrivibrio sp. FC2001]|uniref:head-tail connector protein n=1 Tax=Butyrivibrio sp. FC2001 TaxID=1280671 RepID=UPI0003F71B16|nr:head-tail connector protein [Butyrivibrio sp. FC2001]
MVTLEEAKTYLRVDTSDDDELITGLIDSAREIVKDTGRLSDEELDGLGAKVRLAMLYTVAYLYEHREDADHSNLMLTLRALLGGVRKAEF